MYRLAYRNMGAYEALVVNHTVNAGGVDGIRWYEIRDPNAHAHRLPAGHLRSRRRPLRWMGSIAMDRAGDIALGFSASSSDASSRRSVYAGRLVGDPLGQLSQGEATLFAGTGSRGLPTAAPLGRL